MSAEMSSERITLCSNALEIFFRRPGRLDFHTVIQKGGEAARRREFTFRWLTGLGFVGQKPLQQLARLRDKETTYLHFRVLTPFEFSDIFPVIRDFF